jgi:hypothetical protein
MNHVRRTAAMRQPSLSASVKVWQFVRHFLEMCAAMCIGAAVLGLVYTWAAGSVSVSKPYVRWPELSAFVLAFNMTAPMVAWMRFRGMAWPPIAEMSGAMVVEAFVIVALYWVGALANVAVGDVSTLWLWQPGLMLPVMLVPMLLRLDFYSGGTHHQAHAA